MTTCNDKTREECNKNKNDCTWCDGKTRKYCRKKKGKKKSKLKKTKTCKRKTATRCSPYEGPMEVGCRLSKKNRCISEKAKKQASEIKIISWNVNGIRSKSMNIKTKENTLNPESNLAQLLAKENPDILCLSETKCQCKNVKELKQLFPFQYQTWSCSEPKLGYSGTVIMSKIKFELLGKIPGLEENNQGRSQLIEFATFYLAHVYVPNSGTNQEYRETVWDKKIYEFLKSYKKKSKPLIYCGDLNVVADTLDIYNPEIIKRGKSPGVKPFERTNFKQLLNIGYVDVMRYLNPKKQLWTWWDARSRARLKDRGWRLDYFLTQKPSIIKTSNILKSVMGSDHCPIELVIKI